MPILLAACSAVVYGIADYCGGRASRSHPSAVVTVVGQAVSLVLIVAAVLVVGTPLPASGAWVWGGAAGAAGCVGLVALYYGLSLGSMTVVAPVAAVVGGVLPVVVGVWSGERPTLLAYGGMAVALVAVALVSGAVGVPHAAVRRAAVVAAVVAGSGFGLLFVMLDHTPSDSGLWPLVAARVVSVPLLLVVVLVSGRRPGAATRLLGYAVLAGTLDMAANVLYLAAVRGGLLSLVAVVSSLYPASTVVLAYGLDGERFTRSQAVGLALAAAALALITLGRG